MPHAAADLLLVSSNRYGRGWSPPVAWHGWVVLVGFLPAAPIGIIRIGPRHALSCLLRVTTMSLPLVLVCYLKGELLRGRWDGRRQP